MFESYAHDLVSRFCNAISVSEQKSRPRDGRAQSWVIDRPAILMRGFVKSDTYVLVLAGPERGWQQALSDFWRRVASPVELPIVLATTDDLASAARAAIGGNFALVLAPAALHSLMGAANGLRALKSLLLDAFSVDELHPFDDQHPVSGPMFRGRDAMLRHLVHHPDTSYAIIGPSKMGKTSLIYRYIEDTKRSRRDRVVLHRSLLGIPATDVALARTLRMMIAGGAGAFYDTVEHFEQFVRKFASRHQAPVDIILDEVDGHCGLQTFRTLISLASEGLFRLILLGRWVLARTVLHSDDAHFVRLQPMRTEPLTIAEAEMILTEPMTDLGIDWSGVRHELRNKVNLCGCVPGHIQELGKYLMEHLLLRGAVTVIATDLEKSCCRVLEMSRVCGLLGDLSSAIGRVSALSIILATPKPQEVDPLWLHDCLAQLGLHVGLRRAVEICDELALHHLLGWSGAGYKVVRWDFTAEGQRQRKFFEAMLAEDVRMATEEAQST